MTAEALFEPERLDLADVVGSLLDKGVVLRGQVDISVADVDLIYLDLGVLLAAVETALRRRRDPPLLAAALGPPELTAERVAGVQSETPVRPAAGVSRARVTEGSSATGEVSIKELAPSLPDRVNVDPEGVENGLAKLVLTLIEVLRKVLEHQAIRRMEGGTLSEAEIERLGLGLLRLHDRMKELKGVFGLTDDDLQIDLGPLGRVR
jgi:hypothetical protein